MKKKILYVDFNCYGIFISLHKSHEFLSPKRELRATLAEVGQTQESPLTGWELTGEGRVLARLTHARG